MRSGKKQGAVSSKLIKYDDVEGCQKSQVMGTSSNLIQINLM